MENTPENLPDKVRTMVASREKISLKSSKINARLEKYVLLIITEILIKLGQERFTEMIYTIVKELAINAVKAKHATTQEAVAYQANSVEYQ